MKTSMRWAACGVLVLWGAAPPAGAEARPDVAAAVRERDAAFWTAYNACDTAAMDGFFTPDVEFYHDRGGATLGRERLVGTIRDNLCSKPDWRLRREAVEGTVHVYPLEKEGVVYGAVLSGEHLFSILEKGKAPQLDGHARFTHLWLFGDGTWRMSRILSYDHGPAVPAK